MRNYINEVIFIIATVAAIAVGIVIGTCICKATGLTNDAEMQHYRSIEKAYLRLSEASKSDSLILYQEALKEFNRELQNAFPEGEKVNPNFPTEN